MDKRQYLQFAEQAISEAKRMIRDCEKYGDLALKLEWQNYLSWVQKCANTVPRLSNKKFRQFVKREHGEQHA